MPPPEILTKSAAAIAAGNFKDDDAAEVEGLDDLGGGRIYATRDEEVRTRTCQMLSQMTPFGLQRPEALGLATQGFRTRGQEHLSGQRLVPNNPPTSKNGIVLTPDMPVRTFTTTANKVQERTYATKNGDIIRGHIQAQAPHNHHAAGPSLLNAHAVAPQKPSVKLQSLTKAPGVSVAKKTPATGTLLDRKRQDAVFEAEIKYVKGGGTDVSKCVLGIALITPTDSSYMGYFILFLKNKEVYKLENNVVLNIIRGAIDKDNQVVLHIKENEVRESSHRLLFKNAATAKGFLATISRLLNGGVDIVSEEKPVVANDGTDIPAKPTTATTKTVAGNGAVHDTKNKSTNIVATVNAQTHLKVEEAKVPAVRVTAETTHIQDLTSKGTVVPAQNGEKGTAANPIVISFCNDYVTQKGRNGHHEEPNNSEVEAFDLLSGSEDTLSEMGSAIGIAPSAAPIVKENQQAVNSPLFDLGADDGSPSQAQRPYPSNVHQLEGLNFSCDASSRIDHDTNEVAEDDSEPSQKSPTPVQDGIRLLHEMLVGMVESVLVGFRNHGTAGSTSAEVNRTTSTIKKTVADTMCSMAPNPSFFPNLTLKQKLQVVVDFLDEPEDTQEETSTQSVAESVVLECNESSGSSTVTMIDSSPSVTTRVEYSAKQLLDARRNAVPPPDWLGTIPFLPPVPVKTSRMDKKTDNQGDVKEDVIHQESIKQESVMQESSNPESVKQDSPSRPPAPIKPGNDGILQGHMDSMKPLGRIARPAAPPTPATSPSAAVTSEVPATASQAPTVAKLELKFEKLSLKDASVKSPTAPTVKIEGASASVKQTSHSAAEPTKSSPAPTATALSGSAERPATLTGLKVGANGANKTTEKGSSGTKDSNLQSTKHGLKAQVQGVAFDFARQPQPETGSGPVGNAKNDSPQTVIAVAKSNGSLNGKLISPGRLDHRGATSFDSPRASDANHRVDPTQQNEAAGNKAFLGLNSSRWARTTTKKVEMEGQFTGLFLEKSG